MKAITYARCSNDDFLRTGDRNLQGQLEMTRQYALDNGYEIVAELAEDDRGASGASFELPQLNLIREMARNHQFDILVVREIDRLSRSLAKQLIVEEELKRSSVRIEYVLGEYPDNPEGNLMKNVRASVAEYEREKIRERMVRGRTLKARSGKWVGHCNPFGYKKVGMLKDASLEIDEDEAAVIQDIFKTFLTKRTSMREIASRLTDSGTPIPGVDYNRPGMGVWLSTTIRRILTNRSYIGKFEYSGEVINLPEMAIVSEEDFQIVQEILEGNRHHSRRRGRDAIKGRYLLLDHIFCTCGRRMTTRSLGHPNNKYYYYQCFSSTYPKQKDPCREIMVSVKKADAIVWAWLTALLSMDEERLHDGLYQIAKQREIVNEPKRLRLEAIESQIEATSKKIAGLMRAFGGDDDEDVIATLKEQVNSLKRTKKELQAQRELVERELQQIALSTEQIEGVIEFARQIRHKMDNANKEQQKELVDLLNVRIDLEHTEEGYQLNMSCDLPDSDLCESYSSNKKVASE